MAAVGGVAATTVVQRGRNILGGVRRVAIGWTWVASGEGHT